MGRFSQFLKQTFPEWSVTHTDFEIKRNEGSEEDGDPHARAQLPGRNQLVARATT